MPYYFAYGSNMNPARMRSRGLQFDEALAGQLRGSHSGVKGRVYPGAGYGSYP